MGVASRYWRLVRIDAAGKRKVEEITPAKAFFLSAFPEFTAESEVPDALIQRQLIQWFRETSSNSVSEVEKSQLAERCLLCFMSWQIEQVCWQLEAQFGAFHGFICSELLPFVLDDDGKLPSPKAYRSLARDILQSFDPQQSSLTTWTTRRIKHHSELNAFLLEHGVYLVSDWAILNDTRTKQLERILQEFHQLTPEEVQPASQLLECYHAVYRTQRLQQRQAGRGGRCQAPTTEQLQQMIHRLQTQTTQKLSAETVIKQLQKIASQLREYRIYVRGGKLPTKSLDTADDNLSLLERIPSPNGNVLESEDEQTEFLKTYRQQFFLCLEQAVAQVTDSRIVKLQRKDSRKAEQFRTALQLFHCQGRSMGDIALQLGFQAQYQVSRLLKLKEFRADIRQQLLLMLRNRVLDQAQYYTTNRERLQILDKQVEEALDEQITQVIEAAESEVHISNNRPTNGLFAQRLCHYLDTRRN